MKTPLWMIGCILTLRAGAVPAPELPVLETTTFTYQSRVSDRLTLIADALSQGYPLGTTVQKPGAPTEENRKTLEEITRALQTSVTELQEAGNAARQKSLKNLVGPVASTNTELPKPKELVAVETSYESFVACSTKTLPLLKHRLQMQSLGDERNMYQSDLVLDAERGDGEFVSPRGVACGKFLGAASGTSQGLQEDIKFLSALSQARSKSDALILLRTHALFTQCRLDNKQCTSQFWNIAWATSSFEAVFSSRPLSDIPTLIGGFVKEMESDEISLVSISADAHVVLRNDTAGMKTRLEEEWRKSEKLVKSLSGEGT